MTENICHSGGAKGADSIFGEHAIKHGHEVRHYGFQGQASTSSLIVLNELQLAEANQPLKDANKLLDRAFPTRSIYVNNLLRRNFYQIKETERIYAITPLEPIEETGLFQEIFPDRCIALPAGGTGWAVTMGIQRGIREVYLFDWREEVWYKLKSFINNQMSWKETFLSDIPKPHGSYTGIGSVEIPKIGAIAIASLYE
jgi:hypothetical protein